MNPYFSIILPIYNVQPYLERCIQSVLTQDFSDYEMILVDDGSTDASGQICDYYAGLYDHIRVIHKENSGLSSARNAGAKAAQGAYIWWVDSDDWIEPHALDTLFRASEKQKPDVVKFNYFRVDSQKSEHRSNAQAGLYKGKKEIEELINLASYTPSQFALSAWTHIYSRSFLEANGLSFVSERIIGSEDYLFNLQVLFIAESLLTITDILYSYELREGSLSQKPYKENLPLKYTDMYHRIRAFCGEKGLLEEYEGRICRFYAWHLLHGTCISNEYHVTSKHSIQEARRNVRTFLRTADAREAILKCDCSGLPWKYRVQIWAMKHALEPLFYLLYVVKPRIKKGLCHEN